MAEGRTDFVSSGVFDLKPPLEQGAVGAVDRSGDSTPAARRADHQPSPAGTGQAAVHPSRSTDGNLRFQDTGKPFGVTVMGAKQPAEAELNVRSRDRLMVRAMVESGRLGRSSDRQRMTA